MTRQSVAGQEVLVLTSAPGQAGQSNPVPTSSSSAHSSIPQPPRLQDSDVRDDAAMQRIFVCLQKMCEENSDVMVGMTQLQFGQYLGEPCYAAAATHLPRPSNLPPSLPHNWKQGDFDVLLIHRQYGLVVCEVKAFGDNIQSVNMSQQDIDENIRKKLTEAVSQLDKAEAMLSHLVSDIAPGLPVTKVIAFPNLTARQLQQAISGDNLLIQDLCRCLGAGDPADIPEKREARCDASCHRLDNEIFCGPATTVTVPCTSPPRVSVKTLGQAVWWTGQCYTAVITLFPEQLHLLNMAPPRLFVAGPPGTGKTVVLLMMGIKWLRCGHPVCIVSTCNESRAACIMLYHLLLQTVKTQQSAGVSPGQPHLLQYELYRDGEAEKVVNDLSQAARGGSLYVIADEVTLGFHTVYDKLLTQVPHLHLWAASYYHGDAPAGWRVEYLTRPLRSPPAVVREVEQNEWITKHNVLPYSERGVPDHTDGPPVRRLCHGGQGHSGDNSVDCVTCGRDVASFLHSLRVGVTENVTTTATTATSTTGTTTQPCLQWRDVLVVYWTDMTDDSGMVNGLKEAGIPVRVMNDNDIDDVATARSNVVWVTHGFHVSGLERKVVVCLEDHDTDRFHGMSRCTSQLVIVYDDDKTKDK
ncbi:uncharacterized protein LOC112575719 [Pomacea canaliculata]|uniref:uncharacterized protein LOC112575719 n=1 Tax=Pomacea canaliculata TaxID=400727 RepID=UPI000D738EB2|nr:uncharacterized protein LOC112575719 [Pomacea canaliculata]